MRFLRKVTAGRFDAPTIPVFVYQTLKSVRLRRDLLKEDVPYVPAVLEGWRNVDKGDGYHTLVPVPGDYAIGEVLYLTPEHVAVLDEWEERYDRREVALTGGRVAFVYLMRHGTGNLPNK